MNAKILLCIIVSVSLLSACAENTVNTDSSDSSQIERTEVQDKSDVLQIETPDIKESAETTISEEAASIATTSEEMTSTEENVDLYTSFLKNEAKVHVDNSRCVSDYFSYEGFASQDVTLEELVNEIISYYEVRFFDNEIRLESISYSYIDCGSDGETELALCIYTPGTDDWAQYIVIKEINGKLNIIFSATGWYSCEICITESGYIYSDGDAGVSNHCYREEYLDAEGNYHYIFSNLATYILGYNCYYDDIWLKDRSYILSDELSAPIDGNYVLFTIDFNNTPGTDSDDVYSYAKFSEIEVSQSDLNYFGYQIDYDEMLYDDSFPLKSFFNSLAIDTCNIKELEEMIAAKETAEGLTPEIRAGSVVSWNVLDYSSSFGN